jgi:hypothetical protein
MIRMVFLGLALVIAGAAGVRAQVLISAIDLADDCKHAWPDRDYMHCAGYLRAIVEVLRVGMVLRQNSNGKLVAVRTTDIRGTPAAQFMGYGSGPLCIAGTITPDNLAKAFVQFVDRHPERLRDDPLDVAAAAMIALDEAPPPEWVAPISWETCGRRAP